MVINGGQPPLILIMQAVNLKQAFSILSYRFGITQSLIRMRNYLKVSDNTFTILNYHRVNNFNDPFTIDSVAATDFENQMRYLSRNYQVLSLAEIYDHLRNHQTLPKQCLAITFDDGYDDNYTFAYPILKNYNLPATIFLTVDCVETRAPLWFDQVLSAFKATRKKNFVCPLTDEVSRIQDTGQKFQTAHVMLERLKKAGNDQRKKSIIDVLNELGVPSTGEFPHASNLLTWPRIKEMCHNNISFGSHTMTHPILATLPVSEVEYEVTASKRIIENKIDTAVNFLAYPNGKAMDFNESVIQTVALAGYKAAMTTLSAINTPDSDPYTWGRYKPWQNPVEYFSMALFMHRLSQ